MKVLIVGGGIAGLAIAWRLAREGIAVELVERGICGRGASWAAAGMIAPGGEAAGEAGPLALFARHAREAWPSFAATLEGESGVQISYRESGSLVVAQNEKQARSMRGDKNHSEKWLDRDELLKCEPLLSAGLAGAVCFPDDAQVNNRAVCEALRSALHARNIAIHENCDAQSLVCSGSKVRGLITPRGMIESDRIVLACGAWISLIPGSEFDLPPAKPVKGQMIACIPPAGIPLPNALIWSDEIYLVPRGDRLLIGATVEDAGFDISVDRHACDGLLRSAAQLIPSIRGWHIAECWAGLRPRTPDDAPVLGETETQGLYVAGGQFRNGILFAPAVAQSMLDIFRGDARGITAFDPLRFRDAA
jgi:glycine oxidase